jgi:putative acetyltransferase
MIAIKEIQPHQFEAAKSVMEKTTLELWGLPLDGIRQYDSLADLDDIQANYFDSGGTFLALLDGESLVGTGGIQALGDQSCVIKRLWVLKPYRGQGWGKLLVLRLVEFAEAKGYLQVRLRVATPQLQEPAVGLYSRFGFYPVDNCTAAGAFGLVMEKTLRRK